MGRARLQTVLLASADGELCRFMAAGFARAGARTHACADGAAALRFLARSDADGAVVDTALPLVGGTELARRLREGGDRTAVVVLTRSGGPRARIAALDAGADDALDLPCAFGELHARLAAAARRSRVEDAAPVAGHAGVRVDRAEQRAWRDGRALELTPTEFALLEALMAQAGRVVPRERLLGQVWGYHSGEVSNSLGVYVGYLRRKLEAGGEPRVLQTVRGRGYALRAD